MLLARTTIIHNAKEKKCFVMFMQRIIFNCMYIMAILVVEFSSEGYKIRKVLG